VFLRIEYIINSSLLTIHYKVEAMGIEPNSQWLQTVIALPWYMCPRF